MVDKPSETAPTPAAVTEQDNALVRFLKDSGHITFFLWILLIYGAVMMAVLVVQYWGNQKPTFDYLSYAFPCAAGVVAGLGLHAKTDARILYGISCALLAAGLFAYFRAHDMALVALIISGLVGLAVVFATAADAWYSWLADNRSRTALVVTFWILMLCGVSIVLIGAFTLYRIWMT